MEVKVIGQMDNTIDHTFESANRVYDVGGVAPTMNTCGGGGLQPKILEANSIRMVRTEEGKALRKKYENHEIHHGFIATQYRIRKLTPRECWRLMDFSDEDFEKAEEVNSNTQLYKQAGNSIVKNVLIAIFGQMISGKCMCYLRDECD